MTIDLLQAASESRMTWSTTITSTEQGKSDQHNGYGYLRTPELSDIVRGFLGAGTGA